MASTKWVRNKSTGLAWEVDAERADKLIASGEYEAARANAKPQDPEANEVVDPLGYERQAAKGKPVPATATASTPTGEEPLVVEQTGEHVETELPAERVRETPVGDQPTEVDATAGAPKGSAPKKRKS